AGGAIHWSLHPPCTGGELHRRGTLGAQPTLVDGTVRVALDLEQLDGPIGLLPRIRNQGTPDRAIRANRMGFPGAVNPERLPNLGGMGHVESQDRESRRPRPRGADLEKVATSDLRHPDPPGSGTAGGSPQPTDQLGG